MAYPAIIHQPSTADYAYSSSQTNRPHAHCLLCHGSFDKANNRRTSCRVQHSFNSWNRVRDLDTPPGTVKWVYFAICGCPAIKTVTERPDMDHSSIDSSDSEDDFTDMHESVAGGPYCYTGPHVDDPRIACRIQNGVSTERCETRGCYTGVPLQNPALASTYTSQWFEGGWFVGAPYMAKRLILPPGRSAPAKVLLR